MNLKLDNITGPSPWVQICSGHHLELMTIIDQGWFTLYMIEAGPN